MAKLLDAKMEGSSDVIDAADVSLDLRKEVERHDQEGVSLDISLRAFWRSMQYSDRWKDARVLLTGATGFLGSFILREFLLKTEVLSNKTIRTCIFLPVFLKYSCFRFLVSPVLLGSSSSRSRRLRKTEAKLSPLQNL